MNAEHWKALADERALDAQTLLAAGRWSAAYYLAGYAVECGLKACIFRRVLLEGVIFEVKDFSKQCWTHDLNELATLAKLRQDKNPLLNATDTIENNWAVVSRWKSDRRYNHPNVSEGEARALVSAVCDQKEGVLSWLKGHW